MKKINYSMLFVFFTMILTFTVSLVAMAADVPAPDLGASVIAMIDAVKSGQAAMIVVAAVQLLKTDLVFGLIKWRLPVNYAPLTVLALSAIASVASNIQGGLQFVPALVQTFVTAGFAMSIYESIKSIKSPTPPAA